MKLKDTFYVWSNLCQNFEISIYFKKFPFALQTTFSLHDLKTDNFFSQLHLSNNLFTKKVTFLTKNNGPSLTSVGFGGRGLKRRDVHR